MISVSSIAVIAFIQFNLILVILLVFYFLKCRNIIKKHKKGLLAKKDLKVELAALQRKFDEQVGASNKQSDNSSDSNAEITDEIKNEILIKIVDNELIVIREKIMKYLIDAKTVKFAYIYELRSVYLNFEKQWLCTVDKGEEYWEQVFGELNELLRQTIVLFNEQKRQSELENSNNSQEQEK